MRGRDILNHVLPPLPRFLWGLALMPLAALCPSWLRLLPPAAAALLLVLLSGKRVRILRDAVFLASVVAFSLLAPSGRILAEWGPFTLTQGALELGLKRGLGLLVLVWTSGFAVSSGLRLPGRFGSLLAQSFSFFNQLMELKKELDRSDPWGSLDEILYRAWASNESARAAPRRGPALLGAGALICAATLALYAAATFA